MKHRPLARIGVISLIACHVTQRDSDFLCNAAKRLGKRDVLDQHYELKSVATDTASETMKDLLARMDRERRSLLLVKGAEADQIRARFAQLHVIANNFDDIRGRPNFVCLAHLGPCPDDTERAESAVTPSDSRTSVFQYTRMWRRMLVLVEGIRPVPGRRVGTTRGAVVRDQRPE